MTTSLHPELPNSENHSPWRVTFADSAARLADAGVYSAADVTNKITALQLDTKETYFLASIGPTTWTIYGSAGVSLTNTAPVNVTKAAAVVGVATDAARADHKHDVTTAAPGATGVGTASGEGSATTLARSDHSHQSNTAPVDVTKAAAAIGTSGEPARADHKHDVTTAAPAAAGVGTTSGEGSATSLARSDHSHQSNTAPVNVTKAAAAIGTSTEPARADHKHDVTTAAPVSVASANAEGSSSSLARADHVHTIGTAVVTSANLRDSVGVSVIGRAANSTGVPADIAAGADRQYLRRTSGTLGFGLIANADLGGDYKIAPQHWLPVGSDWVVTAAASLSADPLAPRFLIRRFDDTAQEGVGCLVYIPPGATSIVFSFMGKAITAPPASRNVGWAMGYTRLQANAAIAAWSTHNFPADFTLSNLNTHPQALTRTFTFASMATPLVADNWYLIEFYRKAVLGGTNLVGDLGMFGARVEFT